MSTNWPGPAMPRRRAMLVLASVVSLAGCIEELQFYSPCPEPSFDQEEETIPPCPDAGVEDAGSGSGGSSTSTEAGGAGGAPGN